MATKKTTTKKTAKKAKVPTKSQVTAPKKAVAKKKATPKTAARKAPVKKAARKSAPRVISAEERYKMVEQTAYYMAEKLHFQGDPAAIWVQAEQEVEARISGQKA